MPDFYHSEEFEHKGKRFIARFYHDSSMGAPWKEHDGHGDVSEYKSRDQKRPGERPIGDSDHGRQRFYDWQGAIAKAKREGWGFLPGKLETRQFNATTWEAKCPGFVALGGNVNEAINNLYAAHKASMTPGQYAAGAVQKDFDYLDGWLNDDWNWCGISVSPMIPAHERLTKALIAIQARARGEWDNAELAAFGPVSTSTESDIVEIAGAALDSDDEYADDDFSAALWGLSSDDETYHREVMLELAEQIMAGE